MNRQILSLLLAALPLSACSSWFESSQPYLQTTSNLVPGERVVANDKTTAYAMARKYNVPMNDLIVLNRIRSPYVVWPGQEVTLPAGSGLASNYASAQQAPTGYTAPQVASRYAATPRYGDPVQLQDSPPVQYPTQTMPSAGRYPRYAANTPAYDNYVPNLARSEQVESQALPPPRQYAAAGKAPLDDLDVKAEQTVADFAPNERFLWPVEGPVLMAYGPRRNGSNNDGINIAAPRGTPVSVAANGVVVFADRQGDYGNLVLVRHGNGFATAYAHLDKIIVEKDMVVAKGDMIGTVGSSGKIKGPQLHFQIRRSSKPVDPERYMPDRPDPNPY